MFMVNRLGKFLFGDGSKESLIEIPDGQLYVVRPLSLKGYSELIYKDAKASIRRTGVEFQYQLVITRIYEEGEEELLDEDSADEAGLDELNKDEQSFLLDQALEFRVDIRDTGEKVFAWRDLSGAKEDLWEFVCDTSTRPETVETFEIAAIRCQFERKYKRNSDTATETELQEFHFAEQPIPSASPILKPSSASPTISPSHTSTRLQADATEADGSMSSKSPAGRGVGASSSQAAPQPVAHPEGRETYTREAGELHLFDIDTGTFVLQDNAVEAVVMDLGSWNYWLKITGQSRNWLGRMIEDDINPVFNFEYLSAIFNVYGADHSAYSWLLRFKDREVLEKFQQGLMQALWEHNNQVKWAKLKDNDQDYILEAFNDMTMEDVEEEPEEEIEESDEAEEERPRHRSEEYDSDESQDDTEQQKKDGNVNSQLAIGQRHNRAFVVRGSNIGVFKNDDDGHNLSFVTNIQKVATPKGKLFSPKKVMLHAGDANLIMQSEDNPNGVYRMDLETGKVVDEWKVHDDIAINTFAPETKFAQMTDQQTFLGASKNAMYRVDPRLGGNKLVDTDLKQYASKTGFTTVGTTEQGYIAVGSEKGDIRLYDRLGINAKTNLPGLGDAIIGIDVSADGRWVLATAKTYLLLVDTQQKDGKFEGRLGFERSFPKESKPEPRRLALTPAHVAQFMHETKAPINFTPAKFNTGPNLEETTIVTATGPFVISWSLKKIVKGQRNPYSIKRYTDEVKADNFRFNSDKGIIVALPNEVDVVMKKALKAPTRESIAAPRLSAAGRRSGARRSGYLGRDDIVKNY
ncbi:vacuolar import and degradation protein [Microthyrium microscopicum]|uniref:Vacuolar import and degradation protein n=1 Tax=Microthyrium microscopicum TaxID=703497 RepID=A0A6A6U0N8_9PEZI|nr:vacuolar import and degradation protein [Microthyrium microscopicum]